MDTSKLILSCKEFKVFKGKIQYNDEIREDYYIERKAGVNIFPIDNNGNLILIEEYRSFVGKTILKTPGGGIEKDEEPIEAAKRELEEETSYTASLNNFKEIELFEFKGWIRYKIYFFVVSNVKISKETIIKDTSEQIKVLKIPVDKALEFILNTKSSFDPLLLYGITKLRKLMG